MADTATSNQDANTIAKLRRAIAVAKADWDSFPAQSAQEIARIILARCGIDLPQIGTCKEYPEVQESIRALSQETKPRSPETKALVIKAFRAAIRKQVYPNGQNQRIGFNENQFQATFNDLIENQQTEKALDHLIAALPKLTASNMNRKEKLKHLTFAGRRLQHSGLGKYGIRKLHAKASQVARIADTYGLASKNLFVDFGCGAHEPLGLASYIFANGFKKCTAIDFLPIRAPEYAAISMYDILSYMQIFASDFTALQQDEATFKERLSRFDIKAFYEGDFDGGFADLKDDLAFVSCDILEAPIEANSVSYLVSFAVFEHVFEIEKVCRHLFEISEPGGLQHHFIDLGDHRAYRYDGTFNRYSFLTQHEPVANVNRLRASEHVAAFKAAGFEVLNFEPRRQKIPEETQKNFLPKWKSMSLEDQEAISMLITLRKPI